MRSTSLSPALSGLLVLAALGCGGKLAPLDDAGDAGNDADADAGNADEAVSSDDSGPIPVVDSVMPSSGPNSGGTPVTVTGFNFDPDGGTEITFAGFPASNISCPTSRQCNVVSPYAGYAPVDQLVHVQATVGGSLGNPAAKSSVKRPQDQFTFTAGPPCTATLVCHGVYYPDLALACPATVNFYDSPLTPYEKLVTTGLTCSFLMSSLAGEAAACYGDPRTSSCTSFSTFEQLWSYCGAAGFCDACKHAGGICGTDFYGDPTCSKNPYPPGGG